MSKDYYQTLGVTKNATDAEIKKAFRKLAHEHHPDKSHGNEQKFKEINEAYQVLSNPEKRKRYDQFGSGFDQPGGAGGFSWQGSTGNPFSGFEGFGGNASFDFGDLGDILGGMFGFEQAGHTKTRKRKGADLQTEVRISFDEAYHGTEKELTLNLNMPCDHCKGSGSEPGSPIATCPTCKGRGRIVSMRSTMFGAMQTESICTSCDGAGSKSEKTCTTCKGATRIRSQQSITVSIPAGIDSATSIRLSGKGEAGIHGGARGDLYIKIQIQPHPRFKRVENDIVSLERIPYSVLIHGGSIEVATLTGPAKLKIPAGTESGTVFTLKDKGFVRLSGRGRGEQRITVQAEIPKNLTQAQRKLLDEFEKSLESAKNKKNWW